ncbi:hypothetical protein C2S52_020298 [Perilla frutescens var. hirtella]|nr:hypothetical protein C2S52_020298 [Perilla frutescens var. hirtella]
MAASQNTRTFCINATFFILSASSAMASHSAQPIKGVYYPSWVQDNFPPSSIKTKLYTHVYYAFLSPNSVTFKFDIDQIQEAPFLLNFTSTLHVKNPPVKTLFSISGAAEGTALFSRIASTFSSRAAFIHSSIEVARKFGGGSAEPASMGSPPTAAGFGRCRAAAEGGATTAEGRRGGGSGEAGFL